MKIRWQTIAGPLFWVGATYLTMRYWPQIIAKAQGKPAPIAENGGLEGLKVPILGQESERATEPAAGSLGKIFPEKLPSSPQEIPQYVKEIIERTTTTVVEKGQSQVEEKKTEVIKNTCVQIITEIEKQCNITTSN